jgi:hypothetical protein
MKPIRLALLLGAAVAGRPVAAQSTPPDFAFLGITTESIEPGNAESGLRVTYVFPESTAKSIGLQVDDEIVVLNDVLIRNLDKFIVLLRKEKIGATIRFNVRRKVAKDGAAPESAVVENVALRGKIGSYRKSMTFLQSAVRERLVGKPLPEFPPLKWWDPAKGTWKDEPFDLRKSSEGKVTVIFGFDSMVEIQKRADGSLFIPNYPKFNSAAKALAETQPNGPFSFVGLFRDDKLKTEKGETAMLDSAAKLLAETPPLFTAGAVLFPDALKAEDRENLFFLRNRGVLILDAKGIVRFVQVFDEPGADFFEAFKAQLAAEGVELPGAKRPAPPQPAKINPAGSGTPGAPDKAREKSES